MACGIATLKVLKQTNPYARLESETTRLVNGLSSAAASADIQHTVAHIGSMFTLFFHHETVVNFTVASKCDTKTFARYFWGMIERGVYLPCSQFEANFVSTAHTVADIDRTIAAAKDVLQRVASAA